MKYTQYLITTHGGESDQQAMITTLQENETLGDMVKRAWLAFTNSTPIEHTILCNDSHDCDQHIVIDEHSRTYLTRKGLVDIDMVESDIDSGNFVWMRVEEVVEDKVVEMNV